MILTLLSKLNNDHPTVKIAQKLPHVNNTHSDSAELLWKQHNTQTTKERQLLFYTQIYFVQELEFF